jgi:hypothetical protein
MCPPAPPTRKRFPAAWGHALPHPDPTATDPIVATVVGQPVAQEAVASSPQGAVEEPSGMAPPLKFFGAPIAMPAMGAARDLDSSKTITSSVAAPR